MKTKNTTENAPAWTPGPWRVHREGSKVGILTHNNVEHVATVCALFRQEQNARLIAAAPEMAEALWDTLAAFRECIGREAFAKFEQSNPAVMRSLALLDRIGGAS